MAVGFRGTKISDWNKMSSAKKNVILKDLCQRAKEPTLEQLKENLLVLEERVQTLGFYYRISIEDIQLFLEGRCIDDRNFTVDTCTLKNLRDNINYVKEKIKTRTESLKHLYGDS